MVEGLDGDMSFIKDHPPGPLDVYRKRATFYWKQLKVFLEDPHECRVKMHIWETLEKDPLFEKSPTRLPTEEFKKLTALRLKKFLEYKFISREMASLPYITRTRHLFAWLKAVTDTFRDVSVKQTMGTAAFQNIVTNLGTSQHQKFLDASWDSQILACLALTEFSHGSNAKSIRTTATYDPNSHEFVIDTPDFLAAKSWIGNLGKTATVAILFAQLYTQNECYGLHVFVIPIRDPKTLLPYTGIILGDMGEKIGLHGVDNGFAVFRGYRVPRTSLLNRFSDVSPEGLYETKFLDRRRVLGVTLQTLQAVRIGIMYESASSLIKVVTVAVRYAAVRRQFGEGEDGQEIALLEYPLHQWRIFPYVAAAVVFKIFESEFEEKYHAIVDAALSNSAEDEEALANLASEVHAIISSAKPLLTWTCRDGIQESRECCGGHGFLLAAGFAELKESNDATVTYEGDNNVLGHQTVNWLIRQWQAVTEDGSKLPPKSCEFFANHREILGENKRKPPQFGQDLEFTNACYHWLILYLTKKTYDKQQDLLNSGKSLIEARDFSKVYRASTLSLIFAEYTVLRYFWQKVNDAHPSFRPVLDQLGLLYAFWSLEKHSKYFYQGGFTLEPDFSLFLQETTLTLCEGLKNNILAVTDALAPPDYVLNSVLGRSDGQLYENLSNLIFHGPGGLSRPDWWREIVNTDAPDFRESRKSKL